MTVLCRLLTALSIKSESKINNLVGGRRRAVQGRVPGGPGGHAPALEGGEEGSPVCNSLILNTY